MYIVRNSHKKGLGDMKIEDFCDMVKFESIMDNWAKSTGLATVAVGADGKYISECYNFTDFCIKAKQYAVRTVISLGKCRDWEGAQKLNAANLQGHD